MRQAGPGPARVSWWRSGAKSTPPDRLLKQRSESLRVRSQSRRILFIRPGPIVSPHEREPPSSDHPGVAGSGDWSGYGAEKPALSKAATTSFPVRPGACSWRDRARWIPTNSSGSPASPSTSRYSASPPDPLGELIQRPSLRMAARQWGTEAT